MSSGTGYASIPGSQSSANPAEKIKQEYINHAASVEPRQLADERNAGTSNQYGASVPECSYAIVTADTDVSASEPALIFGVTVIVATATNVIEIRDATAAGAGTVVLSIPASTAIGTYYPMNGIKLNTGLYADFTGTGTLRIDWRAQ